MRYIMELHYFEDQCTKSISIYLCNVSIYVCIYLYMYVKYVCAFSSFLYSFFAFIIAFVYPTTFFPVSINLITGTYFSIHISLYRLYFSCYINASLFLCISLSLSLFFLSKTFQKTP